MAKTSALKFASISLLLFSAVLVADIFNPVAKVSADGLLDFGASIVQGLLKSKQRRLFSINHLLISNFVQTLFSF